MLKIFFWISGYSSLYIMNFFHVYWKSSKKMFKIYNRKVQNKRTGEKFGSEKIIAQYVIRIVQRGNLAEQNNRTCTIIRYPRVYAFKYQKISLHTLLLLVFKIVEGHHCILTEMTWSVHFRKLIRLKTLIFLVWRNKNLSRQDAPAIKRMGDKKFF